MYFVVLEILLEIWKFAAELATVAFLFEWCYMQLDYMIVRLGTMIFHYITYYLKMYPNILEFL